ncbi:MAG TPA: hypothetical protein VMW70_13300, partial [Burkholderiales bacterium]|nr:hypothetical protein [Burkholderiales bacterium]
MTLPECKERHLYPSPPASELAFQSQYKIIHDLFVGKVLEPSGAATAQLYPVQKNPVAFFHQHGMMRAASYVEVFDGALLCVALVIADGSWQCRCPGKRRA